MRALIVCAAVMAATLAGASDWDHMVGDSSAAASDWDFSEPRPGSSAEIMIDMRGSYDGWRARSAAWHAQNLMLCTPVVGDTLYRAHLCYVVAIRHDTVAVRYYNGTPALLNIWDARKAFYSHLRDRGVTRAERKRQVAERFIQGVRR